MIVARRGAQRGYTLIEVVVAFALLAFALSLLLGSLTNATRQVRAASDQGRAALHAQSLLDQAGVGEGLSPGQRDGELEDGRYRWELNVGPFRDPGVAAAPTQVIGAPQLLQLDLTLRWGQGGPRETLQVRSLRLVTANDINAGGATP